MDYLHAKLISRWGEESVDLINALLHLVVLCFLFCLFYKVCSTDFGTCSGTQLVWFLNGSVLTNTQYGWLNEY